MDDITVTSPQSEEELGIPKLKSGSWEPMPRQTQTFFTSLFNVHKCFQTLKHSIKDFSVCLVDVCEGVKNVYVWLGVGRDWIYNFFDVNTHYYRYERGPLLLNTHLIHPWFCISRTMYGLFFVTLQNFHAA